MIVTELPVDYFQDPLKYFARMREKRPVTPVTMPEGNRAWMITRYAEVRAALADPRLAKDWVGKLKPADFTPDPVTGYLSRHLLSLDPPDHTRLRRLVVKAFTARRIAGLRPRIEEITASLLDAMDGRFAGGEESLDLIEAFAFPLPITVICELLGVPVADRDDFRTWSATAVSDTASLELSRAHASALIHYFTALLAAKRHEPADDLLSALISARDEGDRLSENELVAMAFLLLVAGHETTVNLIGNGVLALLLNRAELARLRADPSLTGGAVEELLRYVNPVNNATFRFAAEPVEIGGVHIRRGDLVLVALSSANRDPSRFGALDLLDLGRDASGHLAFGHGIHYCLGAPLARLEAEIAFSHLLARFGSMRLAVPAESLRWRPSILIHGLESLPVRLFPL